MKLLIIIPAYNEAESLAPLIKDIQDKCPQYDYVIVNDGSTDDTARLCYQNHFCILDLPVNTGLSGAIRAGMRYAAKKDYDYVVQIDGDGQHDPAYIEEMLHQLQACHLDIMIGSRFKKQHKALNMRMIGSHLITYAVMLTTKGHKITDVTSGMRLFNKKMIYRFAYQFNYRPEPDTLAYLLNHGVRIGEVQVTMRERTSGSSYLTFSASIRYMLHVFFNIFLYQWVRKE